MRKTRLDLCYQLLLRKKWRSQISNTAGVVRLAFRKLYETGFFHLGKIKCWDLDLQSLLSRSFEQQQVSWGEISLEEFRLVGT